MITVISQPKGYKLTETELDAIVGINGGEAMFTTAFAHGLSDGDVVFVQGPIESYNGFKIVDQVAYNSFKIKNSENESSIEYIQSTDVTYQVAVLEHGFQCVHLPIVYELESDLSPANVAEEAYTPVTIVSQANSNGKTLLNLSSGIAGLTALNWVKLIGTFEGAYKLIQVIQPWQIVIDLAYSSSNSFTGVQVVNYYKNYCINVNVYAGLPAGHSWESEKPYVLAGTLRFTPDENNRVKFSINELLRSYINVRNNLTLDTLPNNLDFAVAFYIAYFESYDSSDGIEITTFEGETTQDDFEGWALNSKLPFKQGSFMNDYISESGYLGHWLVLQPNPIAIINRFFDLSFILRFSGVDVEIYQSGDLIQTIENPGAGIIRVPLEFDSEGLKCIQAKTSGTPEISGTTSPITLPALDLWATRSTSGSLVDWVTGATPTVLLPGAGLGSPATSEILYVAYAFVPGYTYTIELTYDKDYNSGSSNPRAMTLGIYDNSFNLQFSQVDATPSTPGASGVTISVTFLANINCTQIGVSATDGSNVDFTITDRSGTQTTPATPAVDAQDLTEEICITVLEECEDTVVESDDLRLLEDGNFRLLE